MYSVTLLDVKLIMDPVGAVEAMGGNGHATYGNGGGRLLKKIPPRGIGKWKKAWKLIRKIENLKGNLRFARLLQCTPDESSVAHLGPIFRPYSSLHFWSSRSGL